MTAEVIDRDYIVIKVSKKIGTEGINRIKAFVKSLEADTGKPKKLNQKIINELSREINKAALARFKKAKGIA